MARFRRTQNKTTYAKNIRNAMSRKHCLWKRHRQNKSDTTVFLAYKATKVKYRDLITGFEVRKKEK